MPVCGIPLLITRMKFGAWSSELAVLIRQIAFIGMFRHLRPKIGRFISLSRRQLLYSFQKSSFQIPSPALIILLPSPKSTPFAAMIMLKLGNLLCPMGLLLKNRLWLENEKYIK
jgi:hypothetical protein